jgi:hypothetical protein
MPSNRCMIARVSVGKLVFRDLVAVSEEIIWG